MADLALQQMKLSGLQPVYAAASAGGDTAPIGQRIVLHIKNGGAAPITATVTTALKVGDLGVDEAVHAVPAGGDAFVQMSTAYRDPTTGRAAITYDDVASVDVAAIQLP